jgi:cell division septal protein FtsQ
MSRVIRRLTLASLLIVLLLFGGLKAIKSLMQKIALPVNSVHISGLTALSQEELLRLAKIPKGKRIIQAEFDAVAKRLAKHPLIERVKLKRNLTGDLSIRVLERKPVAILERDPSLFVDSHGKTFKLAKKPSHTLPKISGSFITKKSQKDEKRALLREAGNLLSIVQDALTLPEDQLDGVSIDPSLGYVLSLKDPPIKVVFGLPPFDLKAKRLNTILSKLGNKRSKIERIDLDYKAKAYVKFLNNKEDPRTRKGGDDHG